MLPGSALKVCVVVVVVVVGVESEFSDHFGYSLALAKPNNFWFAINALSEEVCKEEY